MPKDEQSTELEWLIEPAENDAPERSIGITEGTRPSEEVRDALERLMRRLQAEDLRVAPGRVIRAQCSKEKKVRTVCSKEKKVKPACVKEKRPAEK